MTTVNTFTEFRSIDYCEDTIWSHLEPIVRFIRVPGVCTFTKVSSQTEEREVYIRERSFHWVKLGSIYQRLSLPMIR